MYPRTSEMPYHSGQLRTIEVTAPKGAPLDKGRCSYVKHPKLLHLWFSIFVVVVVADLDVFENSQCIVGQYGAREVQRQ